MILVTGELAICLVVYSDKHVEIFEWKCCDKISYLRNLRAREQLTSSSGKASGNNISGIAVPDSWVLIVKCILKRISKVFWENFFVSEWKIAPVHHWNSSTDFCLVVQEYSYF